MPYRDVEERIEQAKTQLDTFFRHMFEAPEEVGAVPTTRLDAFDLTPPEVSLYQALQEQGLIFLPQTWIVHRQMPRYRVDFLLYYEGRAYAVEVDGHAWHKTKYQRAYDAARDRFLQMRGIPPIRFTASEVHGDSRRCVFDLLDCMTRQQGREP